MPEWRLSQLRGGAVLVVRPDKYKQVLRVRHHGQIREMVADHVLVQARPGVTPEQVNETAITLGYAVRRRIGRTDAYLISFACEGPDSQPVAQARLGARNDVFRTIEPDWIVQISTTPDDGRFEEQWGLHNAGQTGGLAGADIGAPGAWEISTGSRDILVGVIDTGIDLGHPDLAANLWINPGEDGADGLGHSKRSNGVDDDGNGYIDDWRGWDFYNWDNHPQDDHYHGTHCAGIIGGVGNNGQGVAGVCWQVSLVGLKFLSSSGRGTTSDAVEALAYANAISCHLTSNSWGGGAFSQALKDQIDAAGNAGHLFVASAGNSSSDNDSHTSYPASYGSANLIAVAATTKDDALASFSNWGTTTVDIGAPGEDILSTGLGGTYRLASGTSMAAPYVAGACALLWSANRSLTEAQVKTTILDKAEAISDLGGRCVSGGRLNLRKALSEVAPARIGLHEMRVVEIGDGSGHLNPGEQADLGIALRGLTRSRVSGLIGTLSTTDPSVTILQGSATWPDLGTDETAWASADFQVTLDPGATTPHRTRLILSVTGSVGGPWIIPIDVDWYRDALISGRVTRSADGSPISDAVLTWSGPTSGQLNVDLDGTYAVNVVDGEYTLVAHAAGFADGSQSVIAPPGRPDVDFALIPAVAGVAPASLSFTLEEGSEASAMLFVTNGAGIPVNVAAVVATAPSPLPGIPEATGLWHESNYRAVTGPTSWYYGQEVTRNYDTGGLNYGTLTFRSVQVPVGRPELTFRQWRQTEGATGWEMSVLKLYTEDGMTWLHGIEFLDNSSSWTQTRVDLGRWAGQTILLEFGMGIWDELMNDYEGWYLDDLRIGDASSWLRVESDTIVVPAGGTGSVVTKVSAGILPAGRYTDIVHVSVQGQATITVPVSLTVIAAPILSVATVLVADGASPALGDGDGSPEPGETVELRVYCRNVGHAAAASITANLSIANPDVTVITSNAVWPDIASGGVQLSSPFLINIQADCPNRSPIPLRLTLHDGSGRTWSTTLNMAVLLKRRLSGVVRDVGGQPIVGARIGVDGRSTISGSDGGFTLDGIARSNHSLCIDVTKFGYDPVYLYDWFDADVQWDPVLGTKRLSTSPSSIVLEVVPGESASTELTLSATGTNQVTWWGYVSLGWMSYVAKTSDQAAGPAWSWPDISETGIEVEGMGNDTNSGPFAIGFPFALYGQTFNDFRICSNGWISFTSTDASPFYDSLPSTGAPVNLVAPFWSDLDYRRGGSCRFQRVGSERLIVQWTDVPINHVATRKATFQVELRSDGSMQFRYLHIGLDPEYGFTVGIQNSTASQGLTLPAYQPGWMHDLLAVDLIPHTDGLLTINPSAGVIDPGLNSGPILTAHGGTLAPGEWMSEVVLYSDDPEAGAQRVPVTVRILDNRRPVASAMAIACWKEQSAEVTLTGYDPDGEALLYRVAVGPTHGRLEGTPPVLVYRPELGFLGTDFFTYAVSDGRLESSIATVTILVQDTTDPPHDSVNGSSGGAGGGGGCGIGALGVILVFALLLVLRVRHRQR